MKDCIITYKGQEYSMEQFRGLLTSDFQLLTEVLAEIKNRNETIQILFKKNPFLNSQATPLDYDSYLTALGLEATSPLSIPSFLNWMGVDVNGARVFSSMDKNQVINYLIGKSLSSLDVTANLPMQDVLRAVTDQLVLLINSLKEQGKNVEAGLLEDNVDSILGNNEYNGSVREYLATLFDVTEDEVLTFNAENIKDVGKSSFEIDITKSMSFKTKLILSGIQNPQVAPGFGGVPSYMSLPSIINALQQAMAEANSNSFKEVLKSLERRYNRNQEELTFFKDIKERLEQMDKIHPDVVKEILYALYQPKVEMKFVMWKKDKEGKFTLETYDANVKNPLFVKRANWTENLKTSGLIDLYDGSHYKINEDAYNRVFDLHDSLMEDYESKLFNRENLQEFLGYFGVTLNDKTLDAVILGENQLDVNLQEKLFAGNHSLLNVLVNNLNTAFDATTPLAFREEEAAVSGAKTFNILTFNNSQINDIIKSDNYVEFRPAGSMYIAGKTINATQQENPISSTLSDLQSSIKDYARVMNDETIPNDQKVTGFLENYKNSPYSSNSLLLEMIMNNPEEMSKTLDTFLISLEALKKRGEQSRDDMGITSLAENDQFLTLFGLFTHNEGGYQDKALNEKYGEAFKFRKGYMSFPTISDSSQLPFLKTILIEFSKENVSEEGVMDRATLDLLTNQLVTSDLLRIADFYTKLGVEGTGVTGYDVGAKTITGLPKLNIIRDENGNSFLSAFREFVLLDPANSTLEGIQPFLAHYQDMIDAELQNTVQSEVTALSSILKEQGLLKPNSRGGMDLTVGSNRDPYYKGKHSMLPIYDYVLNYIVQQKEIQTLFAGDLALYFKDGMSRQFADGAFEVSSSDILSHFYDVDQVNEITAVLKAVQNGNKDIEDLEALVEQYPKIIAIKELRDNSAESLEEINKILKEVEGDKINSMFKNVQNNLSKRLKELISPGNKLANSKSLPNYYQVIIEDLESTSEVISELADLFYPGLEQETKDLLQEYKTLNENYSRDLDQESRYKSLRKILESSVPKIYAYLETAETDGQEYTTWFDNLSQLKDQGRLTPVQFAELKAVLEQQSKDLEEVGYIRPENLMTKEQRDMAVMQPTKPLYSGKINVELGTNEKGEGHRFQRYVYIKTSSFPLLPELTQNFPKLNGLRKNMERLAVADDASNQIPVRAVYQSGIKVGSFSKGLKLDDLRHGDMSIESLKEKSLVLSRDNFYVQQDKPFKSDKNALAGKEDRNTRATQFEKILLGDGINQLGNVFDASFFDSSLLDELGITSDKSGKISGPELSKIYNKIYEKEQSNLKEKLQDKLGIDSYKELEAGKPEAMRNIARMLNRRLDNKQDKEALTLIYEVEVPVNGPTGAIGYQTVLMEEAEYEKSNYEATRAAFKFPLHLTPNGRKAESVLNSVIDKALVNLTLPGFSAPVASQGGFDMKGYNEFTAEERKNLGMIYTKNFDPSVGLKATSDKDGKLTHAQVFIANKYKVFNKETGTYEYINLQEYVDENNIIDTDKLPEELLTMFSFRIPTSSHQSGVVIEVAGFLPHNSGDLMIVPKDHTVQIGEDYDIDVRYVYNYHYIKELNGNLKRLSYDDLDSTEYDVLEAKYQEFKKDIEAHFFRDVTLADGTLQRVVDNPGYYKNRETFIRIASITSVLNDYKNVQSQGVLEAIKEEFELDSRPTKADLKRIIQELEMEVIPSSRLKEKSIAIKAEYQAVITKLTNSFNGRREFIDFYNAKAQKASELKVLENNLVGLYKSVFSSPAPEVRQLVAKVLSTDFASDSASQIDRKKAKAQSSFNIFSPTLQSNVMRLGADGKMGIGVHSNSVTINSLLQQLPESLQLHRGIGEENIAKYNIILGENTFNGLVGKLEGKGHRVSERLMESQNSATDNQKLEIMGRRNENAETINAFSLLQMSGLDTPFTVSIDGNLEELSYASMFIAQPILVEYVALMKKYKSSTSNEFGIPSELAITELTTKYAMAVPKEYWQFDKETGTHKIGRFTKEANQQLGRELTGQYLFEQISPANNSTADAASQLYILQAFIQLLEPAQMINDFQKVINIENGGLGLSYFDIMDKITALKNLTNLNIHDVDTVNSYLTEDSVSGFEAMFGKYVYASTNEDGTLTELEETLIKDGYVPLNPGENTIMYIQPATHYAHKIINSLSTGFSYWSSLFPYRSIEINRGLKGLFNATGSSTGGTATELKYQYMAAYKDFKYTVSPVLFSDNIEQERAELFFDTETTESLASYLQKLKSSPEGREIFNSPFFSELEMQVNSSSFPSLIKYNTGDRSPLSSLLVYNHLESLVDSEKALPLRKGSKSYTEADLMKDLLKYSLLSSQENGAIGFRQHMPMKLFKRYKIDKLLRNEVKEGSENSTSAVIRRAAKVAAKNFLGGDVQIIGAAETYVNSNNKTIKQVELFADVLNKRMQEEAFVVNEKGDLVLLNTGLAMHQQALNSADLLTRQFIQHNPQHIKPSINQSSSVKSKFQQILAENLLTESEFNEGAANSLTLTDSDRPYFTIKDKAGKYHLYEKTEEYFSVDETDVISVYQKIPTLGTFGFNELSSEGNVDQSALPSNNPNTAFYNPIVNVKGTMDVLNNFSVEEILEAMMEDSGSVHGPLLNLIREFLPSFPDVTIQTVPTLGGKAKYTPGANKIEVSQEYLETPGLDAKDVQNVILEEVMHHITSTSIDRFITVTGYTAEGVEYIAKQDKNGVDLPIPASIAYLMTVYSEAFKHYADKFGIDALAEARERLSGNVTEEMASISGEMENIAYRLMNVHEFVAGIFYKDKAFSEEMKQVEYRKSGMSIFTKLIKSLERMFQRILEGAKKDSIATHATQALVYLLEERKVRMGSTVQKNPLWKTESNAARRALDLLVSLESAAVVLDVEAPVVQTPLALQTPAPVTEVKIEPVAKEDKQDLFDLNNLEKIGNIRGKKIILTDVDKKTKSNPDNILISKKKIEQDFANSVWSVGEKKADGSLTKAFPVETFSSLAEYTTYALLNEYYQKFSAEPTGETTIAEHYDNLRAHALSKLKSGFKVPLSVSVVDANSLFSPTQENGDLINFFPYKGVSLLKQMEVKFKC